MSLELVSCSCCSSLHELPRVYVFRNSTEFNKYDNKYVNKLFFYPRSIIWMRIEEQIVFFYRNWIFIQTDPAITEKLFPSVWCVCVCVYVCVWGWTDAMKSLRLYLFISGTQCEWPMILKNVIWKQIDLIGMCFFVCRQRFMYVRQCVISAMIILTNIFMQRSTKLSVMIVFSFNIRYFDWKTTCARLKKDISNVNVSLIFRNGISHKANHRFDTSCIHYCLRKKYFAFSSIKITLLQ